MNFSKKNIILTLSLLFLMYLKFNLAYASSHFVNNNISLNSFVTDNLISTCDSIISPFQKIIDLTEYEDFMFELTRYPNGDYLAIGQTGFNPFTPDGFIIKYDQHGMIHWTKRIGVHNSHFETFPIDSPFDYYEVILDGSILSDSTTILVGEQVRELGDRFRFVVALDFYGNKLWTKELPKTLDVNLQQGLFEVTTTEDDRIFLFGRFAPSLFTLVTPGYSFELDKSGNIIHAFSTNANGGCNSISDLYQTSEGIYLNPTIITPDSIVHRRTGLGIIKLDNNREVVEAKTLISNVDSLRLQADFQSAFVDSFLYISHIVRPAGTLINFDEGRAGIIKYNFISQEIIYSKSFFDTIYNNANIGLNFTINDDGSMILSLGRTVINHFNLGIPTPEDNMGLIKIDPQGDIVWQRSYGGDIGDPYAYMSAGQDGGVQLAGTSYSFDTQQSGIYLIHADSLGLADDCNQELSGIISEDYPLTVSDAEVWTDSFPYRFDSMAILPFQSLYPVAKDLCCDNLADPVVQFFQPAYPCGDSVGVAVSVCNAGFENLPADYPISIYDQNPEQESLLPLLTFSIGEIMISDTCILFYKTLIKNANNRYYLVLGDPGNNSTPYEIGCDFPLISMEECDYHNNVSSVILPDEIGIKALDDDYYLVCPAGPELALDLVVPPYLLNPVWNSEFTTNIITDTLPVYKPGWYYLEATTPCGETFFDSVEVISRFPLIDLAVEDTTICQYDTIIFYSPPGHEPLRWRFLPSQGVSQSCPGGTSRCLSDTIVFRQSGTYQLIVKEAPALNCQVTDTVTIHVRPALLLTIDTTLCAGPNNLQNQTFTLTTDTLLTFSYPFSEFCDSTVHYQVTIFDTSYQAITLTACVGDSVLFQNTPIAAGDNQTFINTKTNGCDSTIFVSVQTLDPSPVTEIFLDFCTGDSILIFDAYQALAGIYANNFTNINGCDSLVQITLTELPIFQTENLIEICSGTSVLIHGESETQAGFYEAIFTAENGCDSISFVELELFATASLEAEISPSCADETSGSITVSILEGDGPFAFDWSDVNNADTLRQNLAPGSYTLTLTDIHGCTSLHGYVVPTLTGEENCAPAWYAPNAFSPNDDGRNDRFTFYANARMDRIELLEIFDRRGSLVFRGENLPFDEEMMGWDGYLKGQLMNPQVFVWRAVVVDGDGKRESASGDVTLMR